MGEEYTVSSSMKVEQLEAELSRQLSALRELIGKGGLGQRTQDSGSYRCATFISTTPRGLAQHHSGGKLCGTPATKNIIKRHFLA